MKYIRTKDMIEAAGYGEDFKEGKSYFYKTNYEWLGGDDYRKIKVRTYAKNGITKVSDTIEELCDAYVITSKQGHIYDTYGDYNYELKEVLPQAREECPDEDWDLYGCILVNGIIKQIAKLNIEKGKLELL